VAGVKEIVLVTPRSDGGVNPVVLAAARVACHEAWRVGAPRRWPRFAYGTQTIRRVDKIVGPGNIYVAAGQDARFFGEVGIDMMAGRARSSRRGCGADPDWIAADLLAQAEHDPMARAVLITDAAALTRAWRRRCCAARRAAAARDRRRRAARPRRADPAESSRAPSRSSTAWLRASRADGRGPAALLPRVRHAGAVFLGAHHAQVVGDYVAGPNHVLPRRDGALGGRPLAPRTS